MATLIVVLKLVEVVVCDVICTGYIRNLNKDLYLHPCHAPWRVFPYSLDLEKCLEKQVEQLREREAGDAGPIGAEGSLWINDDNEIWRKVLERHWLHGLQT